MAKEVKQADIHKFEKLEEGKRNRIVNAAMKEFRYGYKKATMDIVVKDAGISKGLLFHYFGTKEQLYAYLIRLSSGMIRKDYFDMMNLGNRDILESFWQMALLKKDIVDQHPFLYDFVYSLYTYRSDLPNEEMETLFEERQKAVYEELYSHCDTGLFRDDIDPKKAIDIINLTMDGVIDNEEKSISSSGWDEHEYERFLDTLREYIDIFRTCFYKEK